MRGAQTNINPLGTDRIGKLLRGFAIPGIISMVINSLYNMVDQVFIGQGVGMLGNGATNIIAPISTFAIAPPFWRRPCNLFQPPPGKRGTGKSV